MIRQGQPRDFAQAPLCTVAGDGISDFFGTSKPDTDCVCVKYIIFAPPAHLYHKTGQGDVRCP